MIATAIIVTRGDQDLNAVVAPIPADWQVLIWDNGNGVVYERDSTRNYFVVIATGLLDYAVYGRYAALDYAKHEIIYVQDDDVIVADPELIVATMNGLRSESVDGPLIDAVVCNMPQEFRHDFYEEHALSGFGAAFPRSLPGRTFVWFRDRCLDMPEDVFNRTCDIVFTGLTQRVLVDVPIQHMSYANDPNRMWKQKEHFGERAHTLEVVKRLAGQQEHQMRNAPSE